MLQTTTRTNSSSSSTWVQISLLKVLTSLRTWGWPPRHSPFSVRLAVTVKLTRWLTKEALIRRMQVRCKLEDLSRISLNLRRSIDRRAEIRPYCRFRIGKIRLRPLLLSHAKIKKTYQLRYRTWTYEVETVQHPSSRHLSTSILTKPNRCSWHKILLGLEV